MTARTISNTYIHRLVKFYHFKSWFCAKKKSLSQTAHSSSPKSYANHTDMEIDSLQVYKILNKNLISEFEFVL